MNINPNNLSPIFTQNFIEFSTSKKNYGQPKDRKRFNKPCKINNRPEISSPINSRKISLSDMQLIGKTTTPEIAEKFSKYFSTDHNFKIIEVHLPLTTEQKEKIISNLIPDLTSKTKPNLQPLYPLPFDHWMIGKKLPQVLMDKYKNHFFFDNDGKILDVRIILNNEQFYEVKNRLIDEQVSIKNYLPTKKEIDLFVGRTLKPEIAEKYFNYFRYDGTGRILAVIQPLSEQQQKDILNVENTITDLRLKPHFPEDSVKIRTPKECLIDLTAIIKEQNDSGRFNEIINTHMEYYLNSDITREDITFLQKELNELIEKEKCFSEDFKNKSDTIFSTLEKETYHTKRKDNFYGRLFETELSRILIHTQNENFNIVKENVIDKIINDFSCLSIIEDEKNLNNVCHKIAHKMKKDPASWRSNIPEVQTFLNTQKPDDFIKMLEYQGKYDLPLVLSIAVNYMIAAGMQEKENASAHCNNNIYPHRRRKLTNDTNAKALTNRYGITLAYQQGGLDNKPDKSEIGSRPLDYYDVLTDPEDLQITKFERTALEKEKVIASGVSGSGNLLHFLFKSIQAENDQFPLEHAHLAAAVWLTYSGGHSFNEAYSVFNYFQNNESLQPFAIGNLCKIDPLIQKAISDTFDYILDKSKELNPELYS